MAAYSVYEHELLCDACLAVSEDFVGMNKGPAFWPSLHDSFHERKNFTPYNIHVIHARNMKSLTHRWYTIGNSDMKFCGAVHQVETM